MPPLSEFKIALSANLAGTDDPKLRADLLAETYYAVRDNYKRGKGEGEGIDRMDGPERQSLSECGDLIIGHHDKYSLGLPEGHGPTDLSEPTP